MFPAQWKALIASIIAAVIKSKRDPGTSGSLARRK